MTTKDEAWSTVEALSVVDTLKLALERLEWFVDSYPHDITTSKDAFLRPFKEALAQSRSDDEQPAQQEPVAWRELCRRLYFELYWCDRQMMETLDEAGEPVWTQGKEVRDVLADAKAALETSPQPQPQQEPVAVYVGDTWCGSVVRLYEDLPLETPLYTSPPASKPWMGLTDEEARTLVDRHCGTLLAVGQVLDRMQLTRTIEAKLREKNQ